MGLFSASAALPKMPIDAASLRPSGELRSKPPLLILALWQSWHFSTKRGRAFFSNSSSAGGVCA